MRTTLLLFILLWMTAARAQSIDTPDITQRFIYYTERSGLVFIEPLQPGMTLYALSRKYNVSIDSILAANPDLQPSAIPLGYPVHIPVFREAISFDPPDTEGESIPLSYRVQPKETLYRISKVYLGISPDIILSLNPRADLGLSIGQVLHTGWYHPALNTNSPTDIMAESALDTTQYKVKDYARAYAMEGRVMREQHGLAVWRPGSNQTHYFVLHATARPGSYMEITNPMLNLTLTAKVSGNIPPGLYPSHVGLVVSPSVARALGILDQQFFARWRFAE